MRSFPYELKLFVARKDGILVGTVGIHDYQFLFDGYVNACGGLSDVAVAPAFRGLGYARKLQEFAIAYCQEHYFFCPLIPLYTDKPSVYTSLGWDRYQPDNSREIRTEDFPKHNPFRLDHTKIAMDFLKFKRRLAATEEERIAMSIWCCYQSGRAFPGKVFRNAKSWLELFADPELEWVLGKDTYFLYRQDRLLEAYSTDSTHPVGRFTPVCVDDAEKNKIMLRLADTAKQQKLAAAIKERTLIFPIADVF